MRIKMKFKVECKSCNTEFESADVSHVYKDFVCNQADGCASDVRFNINEIHCDYGSRYDTNVYEFINGEVPDWIENGVICDACVTQLICAGLIRLKRVKYI